MIRVLELSSPISSPQDSGPAASIENPDAAARRCGARGCVFPAEENAQGLCFYHERLEREPQHFRSYQPTLLVLRQGLLIPGDGEAAQRRARDRQRLAAQLEAFQQGLA
jgi:hypothetical protein